MNKRAVASLSMKLSRWFSSVQTRHVVILLFVLSFGISLQCYLLSIGQQFTRYNNYVIFIRSFEHLINHQNLYLNYLSEHGDLFKYSPTFALFMWPFNIMPDWLGVVLFNFLGLTVFLLGLFRLGLKAESEKLLLLFLFVEIGISLSSLQTNLLIAGLILLAFSALEESRPGLASLLITLTVFTKLFGLVAFAMFLLYPSKLRFILYSIFWFLTLALLPLLVESVPGLIRQYANWWQLLQSDHSSSVGMSFIGWINSWFGLDLNKPLIVLTGALVFCLPLLKWSEFKKYIFRLFILSSVLIWVVIFNHKGESPTYIIAMAGVGIWYFSQKRSTTNLVLLWLCLIFTSFSSTDAITPLWVTAKFVDPYSLKAVFCSVVWFKLIVEAITGGYEPEPFLVPRDSKSA